MTRVTKFRKYFIFYFNKKANPTLSTRNLKLRSLARSMSTKTLTNWKNAL